MDAIQAGLHPDKALTSTRNMAVRMQRDMNMSLYLTATNRALRDVQKQERQRLALLGALNPGAVELHQIERLTDPLVDNPLLRDQLRQDQQLQKLLDAAIGGSAAHAIREHMDVLERQRRYLDPLLDRNFVWRLMGGLDDDLMYRATALHEPDALRILRDKVDHAAALRITDHWKGLGQGCQHTHMIAPAIAFARDGTAMATEAQRMLSVYGPTLAEQTRFLTEHWTNLGLFHTAGLTADTLERADLLARIAGDAHSRAVTTGSTLSAFEPTANQHCGNWKPPSPATAIRSMHGKRSRSPVDMRLIHRRRLSSRRSHLGNP